MYLDKSKLEAVCKDLLADLDGVLSWKWDKSFQALLSEFSPEDEENILSILEKHLNQKYNKKTIRKAPDHLRTKAGLFSDLRSKQLLFSSDPEETQLVFAAW